MTKAIIFDFAGVIAPDVYWNWLNANVPDIEQKREYFEKLSDDVDLGNITDDELEEGIARATKLSKEQVWPVMREGYLLNEDLLAEIKHLKKKFRIGLLSNFNHGWLDELLNMHHLREYMELQVGVKVLLKNPKGKYLLLKRSPEKYPEVHRFGDVWDIVGGRIEIGTSLLENLKREVKEEISLELTGEPKLIAAQDILRLSEKHVVRLTYTANATGEVVLDSDHSEYDW